MGIAQLQFFFGGSPAQGEELPAYCGILRSPQLDVLIVGATAILKPCQNRKIFGQEWHIMTEESQGNQLERCARPKEVLTGAVSLQSKEQLRIEDFGPDVCLVELDQQAL